MMTAELTGADLARWVARSLKFSLRQTNGFGGKTIIVEQFPAVVGYIGGDYTPQFAPHEDWAQGGPLIEKHRIEIGTPTETGTFAGVWTANTEWGWPDGLRGQTPLIAAMRAIVASVYGDTVPDEPK